MSLVLAISIALKIAFALIIGALLKYATMILAPLLIALRRWGALFWIGMLGLGSLGLTYLVAGAAPFREFYQVIMPTLDRPSAYRGNQSLAGMLIRLFGRPMPERIAALLAAARFSSLMVILTLLAAAPRAKLKAPSVLLAGAGLLLGWLLIFSPIAWEHWPIFICPLWGWLLWEMRRAGFPKLLAASSFVLMYFPAGILQVPGFAAYSILLPEPFNSSQLVGVVLFTILAFWRFSSGISGKPAPMQEITHIGQLQADPEGNQTRCEQESCRLEQVRGNSGEGRSRKQVPQTQHQQKVPRQAITDEALESDTLEPAD